MLGILRGVEGDFVPPMILKELSSRLSVILGSCPRSFSGRVVVVLVFVVVVVVVVVSAAAVVVVVVIVVSVVVLVIVAPRRSSFVVRMFSAGPV